MVPDAGSAASHAPIRIVGDADFTPANGVVGGTGSPADPYVIAGWEIDAPSEPGVFIQNTDAHFVVRDVSVTSSTSNPGIYLSYARGGIVENATLTGNLEGISVSYSPRVVLRNNTISSSGQEGIFVWGSNGLVVSGNTVSNSTWDGIYVRYASGAEVVGNVVVDNPLDADTWEMAGIRIARSDNATVASNLARSNVHGITVEDSDDVVVEDNEVTDNDVLGIYVTTMRAEWIRGLRIVSNRVLRNGHDGVWLEPTQNAVITDNEFSGNGVSGISGWGIGFTTSFPGPLWQHVNNLVARNRLRDNRYGMRIYESLNVSVVDNDLENNAWRGIDVDAKDAFVTDNRVAGGYLGVNLWGDATAVTVAGNAIANTTMGIRARSVGTNLIEGNRIVDSGRGVLLVETNDITMDANDILRSTERGIDLDRAHATRISGNDLADGNDGIYASLSDGTVIVGNRIRGNAYGVRLLQSTSSRTHHNHFEGNAVQAVDDAGAANEWDDGYPSGGNWWSDYAGPDLCSGPLQDICPNPDGIGDVPRGIDADSQDDYPFQSPTNIPPRASFVVAPASGNLTTTFLFDASGSWDLEDPPASLEVRWDFEDDGAWDTPWSAVKTAAHRYSALGTYTVRVGVRDSAGLLDDATRPLSVVNTPPVAAFTVAPLVGSVDTSFAFDASASSDMETPAASLEVRWDWDDDGVWDTGWSTAKTASHAYASVGSHTARMQVRDGASLSSQTTRKVDVVNRPPTADAGADQTVPHGTLVTLDGTASTDADGNGLRFAWVQMAGPAVLLGNADTATPSFTPTEVGTYTFELTVDDGLGLADADTANVFVENRLPVADAGPDRTARKNTAVALDGTGSSDPDGDPLTFAWTQVGGPPVSLSDPHTPTPSFTPARAGAYTFRLTVRDGEGAVAADDVSVEVWGLAPIAVIAASASEVAAAMPVAFDASASSDLDGTIVRYDFDFGDGARAAGNSAAAEHSYSTPGTYEVVLTVTDDDGNVSSDRVVVVVRPVSGPAGETNWKPLLATAFATVLALVGAWSARRVSAGAGSRRSLRVFVITCLPFVLLEGATGVLSYLTGLLAIPPLLGMGTGVDLAIVLSGLSVSVQRMRMSPRPK